ncbi:sulfotransferase family 2 domain-containing protein [uncultured Tateyamaria sp.]|uniref:sulfotransferase family 2 domain-containing protein n=1 Tax=uncultured Tateyamaria sp. TaxID=455651 RepID=UPI0026293579|nr:sulfotransferase family 2 domain-containing protein [uncultured Tateyamaria sp.]
MPVCRAHDKWVYFAHVPKCAGTSVEHYLDTRFGTLGMRDTSFAKRSAAEAWSLSPPQHMPEAVRRELLPDTLFDALFATLRHPATRLRSAFLFQREVEKALPSNLPFEQWIDTLPRTQSLDPYALHGHLRPMTDFVPKHAVTFRVENGLAPVVSWLDDLTGTKGSPRKIGTFNVLQARVKTPVEPIKLTPPVLDTIADLYAADFERFGYPVDPNDMQDDT